MNDDRTNAPGSAAASAGPIARLKVAPKNLKVASGPDVGKITVVWEWDWNGSGADLSYFTVERIEGSAAGAPPASGTGGAAYKPVAVVMGDPSVTTFIYVDEDPLAPLDPGKYYWYTVTAHVAAPTQPVGAQPKGFAQPGSEEIDTFPTNLSTMAGSGSGNVTFKWSDSDTTVSQYVVYRTAPSGTQPASCPTPPNAAYAQIGVVQEINGVTNYQYVDSPGHGQWACYTAESLGPGGTPANYALKGVPGEGL